jgi:N-acetylneuraminate synthase|tara:strand:+ start:19 stop:1068 length:1050 start_codon:yes stop_codon:yes gene_type:complete
MYYNSKKIKIEQRVISSNHKPLIIPELGINHNGSLSTAFKIVDAAKRAGAEIIKHQTHIPYDEMSFEAKFIKPGNSKKNIFDIISNSSLNEEDEYKLYKYVKRKKMIFLSTPFGRAAVDRLVKFGVSAFKIGSGELNNFPLLDYICKFKKPLIVSTGMQSISGVKKTVRFLEKRTKNFALMHTTNLYPTPDNLIRLDSITQLKKYFPNTIIGLSDHTSNNISSLGAIALGALIIEKHFVDKKKRKGPDIQASIDESELKELIKNSEIMYVQKQGLKNYLKEEQVTRNFAFASVVSIKDIRKGEKLSSKNIWVKRPGTGYFKAIDYKKLIGKKATKNIIRNVQIRKNDIK